jgi:hypothetical protein
MLYKVVKQTLLTLLVKWEIYNFKQEEVMKKIKKNKNDYIYSYIKYLNKLRINFVHFCII